MKHFLLFFLCIAFQSNAQNFDALNQTISSYSRYTNPEELASQISKDFQSDEEKAMATFLWLTKNIRYDLDQFYNPKQQSISYRFSSEQERIEKLQAIKDKIVKNAFLTRRGVCEEYAQSFKKVCDLLGLESEVIKGYVRNSANEIGQVPNRSNHAWNALKLNDQWIILDATWAAGHEENGRWIKSFNSYFYNIPKNKIFQTHFPDDKIWVLRFGRMSINEFYNQPIYDQTFLGKNATVVSPKNGIIEVLKSQPITLKIKNLKPNTLIYYNFTGQRYSKKPKTTFNLNTAEIKIQNPQRNSDLIIFIDKKLALQYRIIVQ